MALGPRHGHGPGADPRAVPAASYGAQSDRDRLVLAAGGTGGHMFPAVGVGRGDARARLAAWRCSPTARRALCRRASRRIERPAAPRRRAGGRLRRWRQLARGLVAGLRAAAPDCGRARRRLRRLRLGAAGARRGRSARADTDPRAERRVRPRQPRRPFAPNGAELAPRHPADAVPRMGRHRQSGARRRSRTADGLPTPAARRADWHAGHRRQPGGARCSATWCRRRWRLLPAPARPGSSSRSRCRAEDMDRVPRRLRGDRRHGRAPQLLRGRAGRGSPRQIW